MNVLLFTTYDITPEQWADFIHVAALRSDPPDDQPIVEYVLIYSRSQQDLKHPTEQISAPVRTEFSSATWKEIRNSFNALAEVETKIDPGLFLMLDEQSTKDRKVIIVSRDVKLRTPDGKEYFPLPGDRVDVYEDIVWKQCRVPFEKAWDAWSPIAAGIGDAVEGVGLEPYLEEEAVD